MADQETGFENDSQQNLASSRKFNTNGTTKPVKYIIT